jgi:membrane-bound metal-dependent hydrolase YbcI (DUF457 family)
MPQPGVHAVLALATRHTFSRKRWFALGLTFGALLPDADSYPQGLAILAGVDSHTAETIYHRTLTHSLFFALAVAVFFYLISLVRGRAEWRIFGFGLATGMALLHSLVDIFAWFDGVGLLWPLWSINLWAWLTLPDIVTKLLRAANFWAFAAYFVYLSALADKAGTNVSYRPRLRRTLTLQLGLGLVFTVLAFILPLESYNLIDGAAFLLLAYPNALWVTWQMRETIEVG